MQMFIVKRHWTHFNDTSKSKWHQKLKFDCNLSIKLCTVKKITDSQNDAADSESLSCCNLWNPYVTLEPGSFYL